MSGPGRAPGLWSWGPLLGGAGVFAGSVLWSSPRLPPAGVPLHFDEVGVANGFGTHAEWLIVNVGLGALMLLVGALLIVVAHRGPLGMVTIPNKAYWTAPQRLHRLRQMLAVNGGAMMGAHLAFFATLPALSVLALQQRPPALPASLMWTVLGGYVLALAGWVGWLHRRRFRVT